MRRIEEKQTKYKNLPNVAVDNLEQGTASSIMQSINNLNMICCNGIRAPLQTNEQLKQSIDNVYRYCIDNDVRIGVELLSLALGISRQTFYRWSNGIDCDRERAEICQTARTAVSAFVEQLALKGKINPVLSIFCLKSIAHWDDGSRADNVIIQTGQKVLSINDLPKLTLGNEKEAPPSLNDYSQMMKQGKQAKVKQINADYDFLNDDKANNNDFV